MVQAAMQCLGRGTRDEVLLVLRLQVEPFGRYARNGPGAFRLRMYVRSGGGRTGPARARKGEDHDICQDK